MPVCSRLKQQIITKFICSSQNNLWYGVYIVLSSRKKKMITLPSLKLRPRKPAISSPFLEHMICSPKPTPNYEWEQALRDWRKCTLPTTSLFMPATQPALSYQKKYIFLNARKTGLNFQKQSLFNKAHSLTVQQVLNFSKSSNNTQITSGLICVLKTFLIQHSNCKGLEST